MSEFVLIPYGPAFLQLTSDEYRRALGRGLVAGPIAQPGPPPVAGHTSSTTTENASWVTVERLAAASGLKPSHIRAQARAGLMPSRKVGRKVLVPANALGNGTTASGAVSGNGQAHEH